MPVTRYSLEWTPTRRHLLHVHKDAVLLVQVVVAPALPLTYTLLGHGVQNLWVEGLLKQMMVDRPKQVVDLPGLATSPVGECAQGLPHHVLCHKVILPHLVPVDECLQIIYLPSTLPQAGQ